MRSQSNKKPKTSGDPLEYIQDIQANVSSEKFTATFLFIIAWSAMFWASVAAIYIVIRNPAF